MAKAVYISDVTYQELEARVRAVAQALQELREDIESARKRAESLEGRLTRLEQILSPEGRIT